MSNGIPPTRGTVASLHLHPAKGGEPMVTVNEIELVADQGLKGDTRYFGRIISATGQPSQRQVSLMERELISEQAATLGMQTIAPGAVRSNLETAGIDLVSLVGRDVQIGEAVLHFQSRRDPCEKMDRLCQGLRKLMENGRQGVMATVSKSGRVRVGDPIQVVA